MLVDRLLCRGLDIFTDACYNVAQAVVFRALGQVANPVQKTVRFFVIENAEFFIFAELILDPRLRSPRFPYSLTNAVTFATVSLVAALPSVKPPVLGENTGRPRSHFLYIFSIFHFIAPCFRRRVRESASMAMNSEFVGLPLMFDTV